jgi:hypothetical protein
VTDTEQNLYYATASNTYPPPPGGVDVLRFDRATIQRAFGPTVLTVTDATIVHSGLDAAGGLALDSDDDLFVVDWVNAQVVEIDDIGGGAFSSSVLIDYSTAAFSAGTVQFVPTQLGPAEARLEPFQPLQAGALVMHESAFGSLSQMRYVLPARPVTAASSGTIAPGRFDVVTAGGPAHGLGVLALGTMPGPELAIALGGFEQPVFWAFGPGAPLVCLRADFDAAGKASVPLMNPGFGSPMTVGAQVLFTDASASVIGSAAAVTLTLR